jgi:hypothetical protein
MSKLLLLLLSLAVVAKQNEPGFVAPDTKKVIQRAAVAGKEGLRSRMLKSRRELVVLIFRWRIFA